MELALFDFDGTLTKRDSFMDFLRFAVGPGRFVLGALWLSPVLAGYGLGLIANQPAKERVLSHFFRGWAVERFREVARRYALERVPELLREEGLRRVRWHVASGHRVILVSASIEDWLAAWCEREGVELLGSRLEVVAGRVTGRLAGANCYGAEKVVRIRAVLDPSAFEQIHAYGDSAGDREMLALAHQPHFKPFP
ncbi:MAG: HAD family hydrolase [Magnetococcales bacterium]|nr:HAD family hydrolase [Magnetococcales bacterium]